MRRIYLDDRMHTYNTAYVPLMKHIILLYWAVCFSGGISCLVFFFILSKTRKDSHYGEIALFLFSFTMAVGAQTVQYYLQNIANVEDPRDFFKFISLMGMGLAVYALPKYVHRYLDPRYRARANKLFATAALVICAANLVSFALGLESLSTYNWYFISVVFILCVSYSMVRLVRHIAKRKDKNNALAAVAVATIVVLPILIGFDVLYQKLEFLHYILPQGFFAVPLFYLFLNLMLTKLTLSGEKFNFGGSIAIPERFADKYGISSREREILLLLIKGNSYKEIGRILFISLPTVKTHVMNIYKKARINSKIELINLLIKERLVE